VAANSPAPGANIISGDSLTLDSTYKITEIWDLNGYWTYSRNRWSVNKVALTDDTKNISNTLGIGAKGRLTGRLSVGADLMMSRDKTDFYNMPAAGNIPGWNGQASPGNYLPSIQYVTDKLNLFANYALKKDVDILVNLGFQHFQTDDWQWGYNGIPFLYSDNTTVSQPMSQNLKYVSARYMVKF
jgi:hypothetical protein